MKRYIVDITKQADYSLELIAIHKLEYSNISFVERFVDGFYKDVEKLSTLPHRGFDIQDKWKGKLYDNHIIIYKIQEPNNVIILDIIDPRQDRKARKYVM